jgi:Zn-dependent protease
VKALLALLVAGKLGKILLSGGSMLLSIVVYGELFGWRYAVGFVALLLAHEMGHYVAARQRGLQVGLPTFIPFVGAWINLRTQELDPETVAFVGMAGPLLGSTAAFVVFLVATQYQLPWLMAVAYAGFVLNLFNLIPITPLDGGHIVGVISPKLWILGVPLLVGLYFWRPSPLLIIIAIMAVPRLLALFRGQLPPTASQLPKLSERLRYASEYLGLVVLLILLAFEAGPVRGA